MIMIMIMIMIMVMGNVSLMISSDQFRFTPHWETSNGSLVSIHLLFNDNQRQGRIPPKTTRLPLSTCIPEPRFSFFFFATFGFPFFALFFFLWAPQYGGQPSSQSFPTPNNIKCLEGIRGSTSPPPPLQILRSNADISGRGSLLWLMDQTRTAFGGRLLRHWVGSQPQGSRSEVWGVGFKVRELRCSGEGLRCEVHVLGLRF